MIIPMSVINEPIYYHREYSHDIKVEENDEFASIKRIVLVALPFLSLYKPLSFSLSLALGGMRSITTFSQSLENLNAGTFLQTTIALIAFSCTLCAHPLGMLVTTVHDVAFDCFQMIQYLYLGEFWSALTKYTFLVNNGLYLALFLHGGVHLAIASLAVQVLIGAGQSLSEYRKGNYLEAGGHFVMGLIRGNQLWEQVKLNGNMMHRIAYYLQKPLQTSSEYILRSGMYPAKVLSAVFSPVTFSLYAIGEGFHALGNAVSGTPYTYLRGNGPEKLDDQNLKCMTLNACMFWGGLPIPFGGVTPAGERIEALANLIAQENPDILFLQEASFAPSYELFDKIKDQYAHCFTRIGPNPFRMESGLTIFSKLPIDNPQFLPFPDQNLLQRGAFFLNTPSYTLVNTHLSVINADERKKQFDLVVQKIDELKRNVFILGDLNIDRIHAEKEYLATINCYDPRRNTVEESQTNFAGKSKMVDYALLHGDPNAFALKTRLVDTYTKEALSDHKALILEINKK